MYFAGEGVKERYEYYFIIRWKRKEIMAIV